MLMSEIGFGFIDILEFKASIDLNALHYCSYWNIRVPSITQLCLRKAILDTPPKPA